MVSVKAYDDAGRPRRLQASGQAAISLAYDERGNLTEVSQGGRRIAYAYDLSDRLTDLTDADGQRTHIEYDAAGRATGLQGADGQRRLNARQDRDGKTQYHYQGDRLSAIEDPQGNTTELSYNGLGQLLAITQPESRVTQLEYDAAGQAIGLTDPRNNTTRLLKDDFGNRVSQSHPDTGTSRYRHDPAGNLIAKTDAQGRTTEYQYDAANRLIEERSPDETTHLAYDPESGRLALIEDSQSREAFTYDNAGRLIQHTREIDGHRFATGYAYNGQGRLSQKTLPDGQRLDYHYYTDGAQQGQLRAITRGGILGFGATPLIGEIDQDKRDGETGLTFGNGIHETRRYNRQGQLQEIHHERQLKLQYRYDDQGRIIGLDLDGMLQSYAYDPWGRLSEADTQLGDYRYAYDSLGNRLQKQHTTPDGKTTTEETGYPPAGEGNRLLSKEQRVTSAAASGDAKTGDTASEAQSYTYNAAGSPERIDGRRYEYNAQQRPIRVYQSSEGKETLLAEYRYNRFGERIKKVVYANSKQPTVTYYLYDGHQLTAEADEQGNITAQYLYLAERPVIKLEGETAYAIHTDQLGAPRAVTNEEEQLVWKADYSPFGLIDIQTQTITLNLRLPGQYEDQETGTYYNYRRDYDPNTGRYLTSDPIGLKGGINTYAYVVNNPLGLSDRLGLAPNITDLADSFTDFKPTATLSAPVDASVLSDYLAAVEGEEYGDQIVSYFAYTGAPGVCIQGVDVPFAFQTGLSLLSNNSERPAIVYGDTIDGILAEYTGNAHLGAIGSWVRNGEELQYLYPDLSKDQVDVLGIAIGYLPSYNAQHMMIALPAGASNEQITEEIKTSLGKLVTDDDIAALIANLPADRDGPLLVDIYELYMEILSRYQTRLHSDDRVWKAEIALSQAQGALEAHKEASGDLYCETEEPPPECDERRELESQLQDALGAYGDVLATVNNEMIDAGLMALMDADVDRRLHSQAAEIFATVTVATIGAIIPLTLEDAAIDLASAGLGRIKSIGKSISKVIDAIKGGGKSALRKFRNVTDDAFERVWKIRFKILKSKTIKPTGLVGGKPTGTRTVIQGSKENKRALELENESADYLANTGYKVEQNPAPKPNGKEPDYKIEGKYFDCYAPSSSSIDNIRKKISRKVGDDQASRIILNLSDSDLSVSEVQSMLKRKPISGLEELIAILKDGTVISVYPTVGRYL